MHPLLLRLLLTFPIFFGNVSGPTPTPPVTMRVRSLSSVTDTAAATAHVSASFTPTANALVVCVTSSLRTGADPGVATITDTSSLTWTQISELHYMTTGTYHGRLSVYAAKAGSSPAAMTVTSTYGSNTADSIQQLFEVNGSDVANGVLQTFVQRITSPADSAAALHTNKNLAAASGLKNRPLFITTHVAGEGASPQTGWGEISDAATLSPALGLEIQWRSDVFDTAAGSQWATSSVFGAIAFELKSAP